MSVGMIDRVADRNPVYIVLYGNKTKRLEKDFDKFMYRVIKERNERDSKRILNSLKLLNGLSFKNGSNIIMRGRDYGYND